MAVELTRFVWEHAVDPPSLTLLLLALADHADEKRVCWPSVARLVHVTHLHERTVQNGLEELLKRGLIVRLRGSVGGRGRTAIYSVLPGADVTTRLMPDRNPGTTPGYANTNPGTTPGFNTSVTELSTSDGGERNETPASDRGLSEAEGGNPGVAPPKPRRGATRNHQEPEPPRAHAREAESPKPRVCDPAGTESTSDRLAALTGAIEQTLRAPSKATPRGRVTGADLSTEHGVAQERDAQLAAYRRTERSSAEEAR